MNIFEAVRKVDCGEALGFRRAGWSTVPSFKKDWIVIYGYGFRWLSTGELFTFDGTINFLELDWEVIKEHNKGGLEVKKIRRKLFQKLDKKFNSLQRYTADPEKNKFNEWEEYLMRSPVEHLTNVTTQKRVWLRKIARVKNHGAT